MSDKDRTTIGRRIRERRKAAGLTLVQMEQITGINNGNLSRIERGDQNLTEPTLTKIANALGTSLAELLENFGDKISSLKVDGSEIPYRVFRTYRSLQDVPRGANIQMARIVISDVPQEGKPAWYLDEERPLVFNADSIRTIPSTPGNLASILHSGRAMEPRLFDNDSVVADLSDTTVPDSGGVFAIVYGDELLVRRLFRRPGGGFIIKCDNSEYPTIDVPRQEAADMITVVGRVKYRSGTGDF